MVQEGLYHGTIMSKVFFADSNQRSKEMHNIREGVSKSSLTGRRQRVPLFVLKKSTSNVRSKIIFTLFG